MENKVLLRQCTKCGAMVEVLKDCTCDNCGIKCCGETMQTVTENSVDASYEKHLPTYEVIGNYVVVNVPHVMEDEHFIEWIGMDGANINAKKYCKIGSPAKAVFPYIKGAKILSYCNKHGLWSTIVE